MQQITFHNTAELKRTKEELENKLGLKITIKGKLITIDSEDTFKEYEAQMVLNAMALGFSAAKALLLLDEEYVYEEIRIKDHTKRDLRSVLSRLIGTKGKTKNTIESLTSGDIVIGENKVGVIALAEEIDAATTAIKNLIRGTKQSKVYNYLEKHNTKKKEEVLNDFGIIKE